VDRVSYLATLSTEGGGELGGAGMDKMDCLQCPCNVHPWSVLLPLPLTPRVGGWDFENLSGVDIVEIRTRLTWGFGG
jgi:hypothetical protein